MNLGHIRELLRNGFRPFQIQLSNGRKFDVPHSEFIIVGRNDVGILGKNDVITTMDALGIASLEVLKPKSKR